MKLLVLAAICCSQLLLLALQATTAADTGGGVWKGTWHAGERWCRKRGLDGLAKLPAGEAAWRRLGAARLPSGDSNCYWVAPESPAAMEELRWSADADPGVAEGSGCLCLRRPMTKRRSRAAPQLRLVSCHRRHPFLCERQEPRRTDGEPDRTSPRSTPRTPAAAPPRSPPVEVVSDETADDPDGMLDEPVDHAKFPMMPGHQIRLLPPGGRTTPKVVPTPAGAVKLGRATGQAPRVPPADATTANLLSENQRSEFITLLVLYSIVGVVCCVLLVLCLVRCFRGRCGRAKIRYVKQVDADDIPRFMPSSWA